MINRGFLLGSLGRHAEALAQYEAVMKRFGDPQEPGLARDLAMAMSNRGMELATLGRPEEALIAWAETLLRFQADPQEEVQEQVALASLNSGRILWELKRPQLALGALDKALQRLASMVGPSAGRHRLQVSRIKGGILVIQSRYQGAITTLETALGQLPVPGDASVDPLRGGALNDVGYWRILQAKQLWFTTEHKPPVEPLLHKALEVLHAAEPLAAPGQGRALLLGNQAYALFLLGRVDEAAPLLKACLRQGGEALYQGELEDADLHPCPPDPAFKAMLHKLWAGLNPQDGAAPPRQP